MKRVFFPILATVVLMLVVLSSCDNKEESKLTPAEKQKEAIVIALRNNNDLSEFTALLNDLNFTDVKTNELTVFVVKNSGMNTADDGINVRRHIVAGKYVNSSLTNGQKLTALDGTVLTIIIMGEQIYVNGVELGNEIQVSNSIAYIVEKAIPISANTAQYSFVVYECNAAWSPNNPVPYLAAGGATVSLRDDLGHRWSYTTDNDGKLTLMLVEGDYYYQVAKGNASNISKDGFIIAGIFTSQEEVDNSINISQLPQVPYQPSAVLGGLKFVDVNGDAIIDDADKFYDYIWLWSPQNVIYIAASDFAPTYKP